MIYDPHDRVTSVQSDKFDQFWSVADVDDCFIRRGSLTYWRVDIIQLFELDQYRSRLVRGT